MLSKTCGYCGEVYDQRLPHDCIFYIPKLRQQLADSQREESFWRTEHSVAAQRAEQAEALVKDLRDACSQRLEIINGQKERNAKLQAIIDGIINAYPQLEAFITQLLKGESNE